MKYTTQIFLIILLILSIELITPKNLNINTQEDFEINELAEYTLDISQIQDEKYIHLEINGNNKDNSYVLSIVDDFDKKNRIQLAQSVAGNTNLILSKEQIKGNIINIILECSDYLNCLGTISNKIFSKIPLIENKPFYYYTTFDNMLMEFSINSTSEILNIWARGELEITANLEGVEFTKYKRDNVYLVNNTDSKEITFKVTSKQGDYINVGYFGYTNKKEGFSNNYFSSSELIKDGYAITGYLNKNITDKYCYNFENFTGDDKIYGTGIAFDNYLNYELVSWSPDGSGDSMASIFTSEVIYVDELEKYQTICLCLGESNNESLYTFQIYSNKFLETKLNILEPQYNGRYYNYYLSPSSKMALISKGSNNFENVLYYLYSQDYSPKLYIVECDNFPLCSLNDDSFNESSSLINIGKMRSVILKKEEKYDFSPINKNQKLYVVKCDDNAKKNCEFLTLMNRDDKEIHIIEKISSFEKYSKKDQIDKYKVSNLLNYVDLRKDKSEYEFEIEINVFAGDVDIFIDFPKEIETTKIYNLNKLSLSIKLNTYNLFDSLFFSVKSSDNSFYTIQFFPKSIEKDFYMGNVFLSYGFPRLFSFSAENSIEAKNLILMLNINRGLNIPQTINFNSMNCEIEVIETDEGRRINNTLETFGRYHHLAPRISNEEINIFKINILNDDLSNYNNKMCQVYLSYKDNLVKESDVNYLDILVLDNVPQQIMFNEKLTHVSYGYFHSKWENDIIIKYSSKHKAKYIAKIYYANNKREKEESIIMGDGIIYLNYEEWENICKDENCFIKVDITLDRVNFEETPKPILELTIKSVEEKMVSYIPKNEIVKDYIHYQKSQYYFAEIGKNEVGYVNVHFLKGSGQIVAKIVEEGKTEQNPDWKGKYVLPTKDNADLKMDTFTKKLKFSAEKYNCENKCYLIINVYSDIKADKIPTRRVFPYTLFVHSYPNNYNNTSIPVISAPLNDYIIGSLEKGKEKDAYDFYQFNLNLNNETIVIDIHSVIGNVLVNIGNKRPIINEADFKFSLKNDALDHDNVFVISKEEIIEKSPSTDLKDLTLTISLHSSKFNDTITKIPYSFSVRLLDEPGKGIYLINSEHQSLRNTELSSKDGDDYQCYYLLKYDYLSDISPLMLYAIDPKETNRPLTIAAKYVDYEDYLFGNLDLTTFDFANKGEEKYLFIKNGFIQNDKPKSILVLVEKNKEAIIQFYASFYTHYDSIYIDPGSPRMKFVPKNETLSLFSSNLLPNFIDFRQIEGKGEVYYEGEGVPHHFLNTSEHSLGLSFMDNRSDTIEIIIKEINEDNSSIGFIFYYEQYLYYGNSHNEDGGSEEGDKNDKTTLIIVVVASVFGLAIIVGLIWFFVWYRKKKNVNNEIYKISFEKERESNLLLNDEN